MKKQKFKTATALTAHCIGGWAQKIGKVRFFDGVPKGLDRLFYPGGDVKSDSTCDKAYAATPKQAARALRNYLIHGTPKWAQVVAAR
jgi:hypothetical protein